MFSKAKPATAGHLASLIGAGNVVSGDIVFSGGLRIDGSVAGNVRAAPGQSGTLVIGESGRVEGLVEADHLVVHGQVSGRVEARSSLTLHATARVHCDVVYAHAEIHQGAVIQGRLLRGEADIGQTAPALRLGTA